MNALIALLLVSALGFIFGGFLFRRARPGSLLERFFLSGAEFLLLGAVLGPHGFSVLTEDTLAGLEPFVILALSWIGLLMGLQLRVSHLMRFPRAYFAVATVESLVAMSLAFLLFGALFWAGFPRGRDQTRAMRAALLLAAVIALSSPAAAHNRMNQPTRGGHGAGLLRFVSALDPFFSLGAVAVVFSVWHIAGSTPTVEDWGTGAWLLASLGGGVLLGGAFVLLLRTTRLRDEIVLIVLGMAIFSGGLASVFQLSPLVVCVCAGIVAANFAPQPDPLLHMVMRLERPLYVALLVLAGAAWRFDSPWGYALAAALILVRAACKFASASTAKRLVPLPFSLGSSWWLGLMPQGALAVAIGLSYGIVYHDELAQTAFAAVLVSTVVLTFTSGRFIDRALDSEEGSS